jgi:hypothetical protein
MPTDYVEDYEELTGRERDGTIRDDDGAQTKVITAPPADPAPASPVKVETK